MSDAVYLGSFLIVYANLISFVDVADLGSQSTGGGNVSLDLILRTLASSRRRQILDLLVAPTQNFPPQRDGDLVRDGVCGLLIARKLKISQPTASDHLNMMVQAGFLRAKRIKQWTFYKRDERSISNIKREINGSF